MKEVRNAIAHNKVVFDCRFRTIKIKQGPLAFIEKHTKITNINFSTITDYVILIAFYLKKLQFNQGELLEFITNYEDIIAEYSKKITPSNMQLIFGSDVNQKIKDLKTRVVK